MWAIPCNRINRMRRSGVPSVPCAAAQGDALMSRHEDENLLNGELARLLTERGIPAQAERREKRKKMDVVTEVDGLRVVLEAETGFKKKRQAIKDADARLKQGLTNLVFAVCYPDSATVAELARATVAWTLRTRAEGGAEAREGDAASARWSDGGIGALAEAIRQAPGEISDADKTAQQLSDALDAAVQRLSGKTRAALARKLDLPRTKKSQTEQDDGYFTAAKRGLLVVATAMLFHHRLRDHLPAEAPDGWEDAWPPASPASCAERPATTILAHREAWRAILAVDYRPVFETAIAALDALPATPDTGQMVRDLAGHIDGIAGRTVGLRHDLLGRVFHRVLDTARYDGSFYTSTAAATLLAALAIREEDADWSDPDAIARLRICDPACGTGTLLMAAAERIGTLRGRQGTLDQDAEALLAEALVEEVLWGYDINLTATHIAASTLGMLSPKTQFRKMNIHRTLLGVFKGETYVGSLEFLQGQPRLMTWPSMAQQVDTGEPEPPPPMDLVIMNPPFTRDSLRHDQFSREDKQAIKAREKELLHGQTYRDAIDLSGASPVFTVLGTQMLRSNQGTLSVVLPSMIPTAPSGAELRTLLGVSLYVDTVVSSHDPERIFFSENTNIGEVLLVCRRWNSDEPKPPTRFINLAENPATPLGALDLAHRLERDEAGRHTVQWIDADRIARGDWNAVNFLSPYLVEAYRTLTDSGRSHPTLADIADVGPEGRRIRDSYKKSDMPTASGRRALWHHKTDITTSMRAETDVFIEPKPGERRKADRYWEQRSNLLLPHRLWLPLARTAAVVLDERVVGSRWTPCRPHDGEERTALALCAYLNSSIGILALLGGRDNRKPSYPQFSLDALRSLPVPNFRALGDGAREMLTAAFERLKDEELLPFPYLAGDPVRSEIDDAVTEALGLDAEWVASIRRELSREPSVTNRRYEA